MKRSLTLILFAFFLTACVGLSLEDLSPVTQVYAVQKEFNDVYAPTIKDYIDQEWCNNKANPPVLTACADPDTVIVLNEAAKQFTFALGTAKEAVKDASDACKEAPDSAACTSTGQLLSLAVSGLRAALARVASEIAKHNLENATS